MGLVRTIAHKIVRAIALPVTSVVYIKDAVFGNLEKEDGTNLLSESGEYILLE